MKEKVRVHKLGTEQGGEGGGGKRGYLFDDGAFHGIGHHVTLDDFLGVMLAIGLGEG